jgi:hypothetical protein
MDEPSMVSFIIVDAIVNPQVCPNGRNPFL